jgi:hypothetical protein
LQEAQHHLESVLLDLEKQFPPTPTGLGIALAWGLPYFQHYIPSLGKTSGFFRAGTRYPAYLPVDLSTSKTAGHTVYGQQGLPSKLALAANIPGAKSIPPHAEVFLGFTTTLQANMAPGVIANLEAIPGVTNQWPNGYFKHGTTMHLSHMFEDLEAWYGSGGGFSVYAERLRGMLRPGLSASEGTLTLNPPIESEADVAHDVQQYKAYGHSGSMQTIVRQTTPTTDNYGNVYPTGTPVSTRGDFNTLDNPFYYTSDPLGDRYSNQKAAGMHFLIFQPTIGNFNRTRLAMDGHYPDGTILKISPRSVSAGINSVLFTTHRQNYLVPSRSHRSFPLAEFLS